MRKIIDKAGRVAAVASIYIGTVVGAGFASGQEIQQFFSKYGGFGTYGLLCSTLLLSYLGSKAMEWGRRIQAASYQEFLHHLAGGWLGRAGELIMTVFLLLLTGVMLSGAGMISVQLGFGWGWGCWGTILATIVVLSRRLSGIKGVNLLVIPLLFLTGIRLRLSVKPISVGAPFEASPSILWLVSAIQYSAYNIFLALPVLVTLHQLEKDRQVLTWGGILGGFSLGLLALLFHQTLLSCSVGKDELPLLTLASGWGGWWRFLYPMVLWGELFTTLTAHTYGLATRLGFVKNRWFLAQLFILLCCSVIVSRFGFSRLIGVFYPIFGIASLLIMGPLGIRPLPLIGNEEDT